MPHKDLQMVIQHWWFDPIPPWWRLNDVQTKQYFDMEQRFAAKEAEIRMEKIAEFTKIVGGKI
jgi:hypothetical protein